MAGNLETEVRVVAADVPVAQAFFEPVFELVGDGFLHGAAVNPAAQHVGEIRHGEKQVFGLLLHRRGAGVGGFRVDQVRWAVGRAADFAIVAVLSFGPAARAGADNVTVGEEQFLLWIEHLADAAPGDMAIAFERQKDRCGQLPVFFRMRRVIVVEADEEAVVVALMFALDAIDQLLGGDALAFGAEHDGGAVGVVGADEYALMPAHFLQAHPDIGLDRFHDVAEMDVAVRIGQGARDENLALAHLEFLVGISFRFRSFRNRP